MAITFTIVSPRRSVEMIKNKRKKVPECPYCHHDLGSHSYIVGSALLESIEETQLNEAIKNQQWAETNEEERTALGGALRNYFDKQAQAGLGLVFDPEGVIEDYNWDQFFIKGGALRQEVFSAGLPDLLLISQSLAHGAAGIPSRPYPNGIMITRDGHQR